MEVTFVTIVADLRLQGIIKLGTQLSLVALQLQEIPVGIDPGAVGIDLTVGHIDTVGIQPGDHADIHIGKKLLAIAAVKGFQHRKRSFTATGLQSVDQRLVHKGQLSVVPEQCSCLFPGSSTG